MATLKTNSPIQVVREGRFMNAYQNGIEVTKEVPQPIRRKALNKGADLMFENGEFRLVKSGSAPKVKAIDVPVAAPMMEPVMDFKVSDITDPITFIKESPGIKPADQIGRAHV